MISKRLSTSTKTIDRSIWSIKGLRLLPQNSSNKKKWNIHIAVVQHPIIPSEEITFSSPFVPVTLVTRQSRAVIFPGIIPQRRIGFAPGLRRRRLTDTNRPRGRIPGEQDRAPARHRFPTGKNEATSGALIILPTNWISFCAFGIRVVALIKTSLSSRDLCPRRRGLGSL